MYGCVSRLFKNQINIDKHRLFFYASKQTRGKRKGKKEVSRGHMETSFWFYADGQRTVAHTARDK